MGKNRYWTISQKVYNSFILQYEDYDMQVKCGLIADNSTPISLKVMKAHRI